MVYHPALQFPYCDGCLDQVLSAQPFRPLQQQLQGGWMATRQGQVAASRGIGAVALREKQKGSDLQTCIKVNAIGWDFINEKPYLTKMLLTHVDTGSWYENWVSNLHDSPVGHRPSSSTATLWNVSTAISSSSKVRSKLCVGIPTKTSTFGVDRFWRNYRHYHNHCYHHHCRWFLGTVNYWKLSLQYHISLTMSCCHA